MLRDEPCDFRAKAFIGCCDHDVELGFQFRKGERDWQAVAYLMDLIVVEEEADPHICLVVVNYQTRSYPRISAHSKVVKAVRWLEMGRSGTLSLLLAQARRGMR